VNEIAKLPSGVAVVYQNDWVIPVLTMIDKADVEESTYVIDNPVQIKPLKVARTDLISVLMQPWLHKERIRGKTIKDALRVLDLGRNERKLIAEYADDYMFLGGNMFWSISDIDKLQKCLKSILNISDKQFVNMVSKGDPDALRNMVRDRTASFTDSDIDEICNVLTKVEKNADDND
jgi:hypothetical protein